VVIWRGMALVALCCIAACSSPVALRNAELASAANSSREILTGSGYRHVVYARGAVTAAAGASIHIYIGGDGRAFIGRDRIARDPTVYPDPGLQMMLQDEAPAYYLARPCYHGTVADEGCSPLLWTTQRYSQDVVNSVASVVSALQERHPDSDLRLFGYSGGGVIALYVAAQTPGITEVITVASPLDTNAWAAYHSYTPLTGSLNPAQAPPWPAQLRQIHLLGADDSNVPPQINAVFRDGVEAAATPAEFIVIEGQGHCCWSQSWGRILFDLQLRN
jgi:pimeloyl-ACP methyl ester carboxylesterase